jgi:hypothetical protein
VFVYLECGGREWGRRDALGMPAAKWLSKALPNSSFVNSENHLNF